MKDAEFKAEYRKLKPRYDVISIIEARTSQKHDTRRTGAPGGNTKIEYIPA
jgi:hypothetical protein